MSTQSCRRLLSTPIPISISSSRIANCPRGFSTTASGMLNRHDLSISEGHDESQVLSQATELVSPNGRWRLTNFGAGLERDFKFKTFKSTWDFMNDIAGECKVQRHHPEWSNVYNRTTIRWTTHKPQGLSLKDTAMARFCDEVAGRYGEVWPDPDGKGECGLCGGGGGGKGS
ncbi:transcriptional coactivator/pterin dehydratase [Teratosphaeria nubilosa]|uniref:4a-hydroxytetrahydrobiopterin dehydratase n=1 Tax=Teratosphaeria nubilosa TaxID=161662 RepID=A0A6G1LFL5_9PEZI|nr:transcriptional coactivator/pterin dehydratase [Teratosphaeria nubilosa]